MAHGLAEHVGDLRRLVKTDPDPRVRRRAQAVLGVARLFRTAPHRIRAWGDRYLERGRAGLAAAPGTGRPPKLGAGELALLDEARQGGPPAYGWPVSTWSIRDLQELLRQHRQVTVSLYTVYRAVRGLGYRYRRPRHDLKHRQDADAVATARQALAWLGKEPASSPAPSTWSSWTRARSTASRT